MLKLADDSYKCGQYNSSFLSYFLLGDVEKCVEILVETDRVPEATFFAHSYCPSQVSRLVALWREKAAATLIGIGKKVIFLKSNNDKIFFKLFNLNYTFKNFCFNLKNKNFF